MHERGIGFLARLMNSSKLLGWWVGWAQKASKFISARALVLIIFPRQFL